MTDAPANADPRFQACLAETLKWEGGHYGGATMNGITQKEYDAYGLEKDSPSRVFCYISAAEREEIYRTKYGDEVNGDRLPLGVDLITFDFGVNAGPQRGIKCLQSALGVWPLQYRSVQRLGGSAATLARLGGPVHFEQPYPSLIRR